MVLYSAACVYGLSYVSVKCNLPSSGLGLRLWHLVTGLSYMLIRSFTGHDRDEVLGDWFRDQLRVADPPPSVLSSVGFLSFILIC